MTPEALVDRPAAMFPGFRRYWDAADNGFRGDDRSFTLHGVFCRFTHFFRERHAALSADGIAALGAFVSECMTSDVDHPLGNAAATCFIENIAGEPCGRILSHHLIEEAKRYWLELL